MVTVDEVRDVLGTILDPEMPISIVDLGIVVDVRIRNADQNPARQGRGEAPAVRSVEIDIAPTFVGCPALDVIRDEVRRRVGQLPAVADVRVTFVNDPPWSVDRISAAGREALRRFGVTTPARGLAARAGGGADANAGDASGMDDAAGGGRRGTLVPLTVSAALAGPDTPTPEAVACPFCGSTQTHLESAFGPTRCKMIFYCDACRNSFEHLKRV